MECIGTMEEISRQQSDHKKAVRKGDNMVNMEPEARIASILDIVVPSLMYSCGTIMTPQERLDSLESYRLRANELNAKCDYLFGDIEQIFTDARHYISGDL